MAESSVLLPIKKKIQNYAFKKCNTDPRGPVMTISMGKANVWTKYSCCQRDWSKFHNQNTADPEKIHAIVTRSLSPEYRHAIIKSFNLLHQKELTSLTIVGDGTELASLKVNDKIEYREKGFFTGRIPNTELPELLRASNFLH
jgi:predicted transcriptional regulator